MPLPERLRAALGPPDRVERLPSSPGSAVWRVDLGGTAAVVKHLLGADADARFHREVTALTLAADVRPALVPQVLGSDAESRVVVLEHLAGAAGFPDPVAYAERLARLHAVSADLPAARSASAADVAAFLRLCAGVGLPSSAKAEAELLDLVARLSTGSRRSLLHGDPCPGNVLSVAGRVWFLDFEQAGSGDGLAELAYLRMGFPTCGLATVLPDPVITEAEAAYHRAAPGSPGSLTDHWVSWLLRGDALVQRIERRARDQFARLLVEDWSWGPTTARQRFTHRLGVVAGQARDTSIQDTLPHAGRLFTALHDRVVTRW
ncbi:phosphotransferase [Actinokineospora sp.]|uniref:phosphotransferase n=1 Tax=Actinokineospora sp. TaxID=1872133 RepID=UPI0040383BD5